jgi:hypothetical protein
LWQRALAICPAGTSHEAKQQREANMATLFFRCPVTGREVSTGLEIDRASYARIDDDYVEISCPYCKEPHPLASVKSWLEDASAFETWVN